MSRISMVTLFIVVSVFVRNIARAQSASDVVACFDEAKAVLKTPQPKCEFAQENSFFSCKLHASKRTKLTDMAQGLLLSCIREKFGNARELADGIIFHSKEEEPADVVVGTYYWKTKDDNSIELFVSGFQHGRKSKRPEQ
jgi:hypothetical protein